MLASVGSELPDGDGWVFEPKYDGIRILAFVTGGGPDVALISRNGLDKTRSFPEIADALRALHAKVRRPFVLDGEIVVMLGDAPMRFQQLQTRMHVSDRRAIEEHRSAAPAALMAFDVLLDGDKSLVTEPWRVRRKHLAELLLPPGGRSSALRLGDVSNDGQAMVERARTNEWEGIIAKRTDAPYQPGHRSKQWLKLKIERRQEFVVGGWTEPRNSREYLGAVLLGYYADGAFTYAGHTGTGFTRKSLAEMYRRLVELEQAASPFTSRIRTNQPAHWVKPAVVVEIKFNEWTAGGKLRQPVYLGVRDDKDPREVTREPTPEGPRRALPRTRRKPSLPFASRGTVHDDVIHELTEIERADGSGVLHLETGELEVSNLGRVFFPEVERTKGDLMRFYVRMSPLILPTVADRPLVMKRFPNGISGKAFYQQKAPADAPRSVRVESVSDEGMTTADRLVGRDLATLLYLVQLGAISVDPWHSRVGSVRFADYSIVDLDPGPKAPFERVVEVACVVNDVLDELGLRAVPKTSGASGIHIVLPLGPGVTNDAARTIAEVVATEVAQRKPRLATVERSVNRRPAGAVYVDFLQNIRGKTVAGVYSVRAQPRATVSTPLDWSELADDLDPTGFTIDTVPARVAKRGDLWAKAMGSPNQLDNLLRKAGSRG
ncbi:MAG TPA: DNA ligase D [Gemmatimonadaceae bacterium]|nr:DNA ligase D [Gemmatimonadaceae bacterium]